MVIASAANALRTAFFILFDIQLMRLQLLPLSARIITWTPWLPPSLWFPNATSVYNTSFTDGSKSRYFSLYWSVLILLTILFTVTILATVAFVSFDAKRLTLKLKSGWVCLNIHSSCSIFAVSWSNFFWY